MKNMEKHKLNEYFTKDDKFVIYDKILCDEAQHQHDKVDENLSLLTVALIIGSVVGYSVFHLWLWLIPFVLLLVSHLTNMMADKSSERLYYKMSECDYYEDAEELFKKYSNQVGRPLNRVIWGSFVVGVLSFVVVLFM